MNTCICTYIYTHNLFTHFMCKMKAIVVSHLRHWSACSCLFIILVGLIVPSQSKKSERFLKSHWSLIKNGYPEQLVHISVKEIAAADATDEAAIQQKERNRQEWQPSTKDDLFLLPCSLHMNCYQKPLPTHVEGLIKTNYYNIHLSLINKFDTAKISMLFKHTNQHTPKLYKWINK